MILKTRTRAAERGRAAPLVTRPSDRPVVARAESQMRTCTHCGRHTTFTEDDPAGGWYACVACGRYA